MAKILLLLLCLSSIINSSNEASILLNGETEQDAGNSSANSTSTDNFYEYVYSFNYPEDGYIIATDILNRYGLITIVCLALFGNTVIFIVLTKKRNRSFPTSMYLTSLAVSEILLVLVSPMRNWLRYVFGIRAPIEIQCKVLTTLLYTNAMNSSWTLVVIAIERVLSVTVPHKVKIFCSTHRAKRVLIGIWTAFLAFTIFLANAFQPYGETDCAFIKMYTSFYIFDLSIVILVFMVPFIIILVATVIIVVKLFKRKKKNISSSKGVDVWQITTTLVFTNIAFIATVMPINIVFMVYKIQGFLGVEQISNILFWMNLFRFLLYLNACLNFFIYFLSGSRFRCEVKELFSFGNKKLTVLENRVSNTRSTPVNNLRISVGQTPKKTTNHASRTVVQCQYDQHITQVLQSLN